MSDRDFFTIVTRMGQEERESLMISEKERRRTFVYWKNAVVDPNRLAEEGFYYLGGFIQSYLWL